MKVFNTLTNKLEEFKTIEQNKVSMYVCGPTVYNYIHIGNARPVIFFDTVKNYFEHLGYEVKFVSNFTDIDDKIIDKAIELGVDEKEISEKYIKAFLDDVKRVNSSTDYIQPKVTNYMDHIIDYISKLIELDYAYISEGDVYFRVEKAIDYGMLSNRKVEDLVSGARIKEHDKKESPLDFTLWKNTGVGITYDAPFGEGRPGWHTECVAMIDDIFGGKIDIHGGGNDLMFPHHENEIAHSMVLNNHPIANYWMHNGRLNIDGKKMSKSEGEMVLVKDLELDSNAFRLFMLSTHYRSPLNYNEQVFDAYSKEWEKIYRLYKQLYFDLAINNSLDVDKTTHPDLLEIYKSFKTSMDEDFNTANAITSLQKLMKITNQLLRSKSDKGILRSALKLFDDFFFVLGLKVSVVKVNEKDQEHYKKWLDARAIKDFEAADQHRDYLVKRGLM